MYNQVVNSKRPHAADALLLAARKCLQEQGYGRTTAREVARTAGVSLGSIPYHFESMDALLAEALAESARDWIDRFSRVGRRGGTTSTGEAVRGAIDDFYALIREERELLVAFIEALARANHMPSLRRQLAAHYREFRKAAAERISSDLGADLKKRGVDPEVMASLLLAVTDGLIVQFLLDPKSMPNERDLRDLLSAFEG